MVAKPSPVVEVVVLFSLINFHSVNGPFPSCFEPCYDSEARCTAFVMKMSFFIHVKISFVYT